MRGCQKMESNKPKVLVFTDWYLPGYKAGGPISSVANLVQALGNDIDFKIVCSDRDYMTDKPYSNVAQNQWTRVGQADVFYISPEKLTKSAIRKKLQEFPGHRIYINGIFSKYFSVTPLIESNKLNRKITVAPRGMLAPGALGIKAKKKRVFLNLAKFLGWYRQVDFHATHPHEANQIESVISRKVKIKIIPNLPTLPKDEVKRIKKQANQIQIVSVARIAKEKNTAFALECLKNIPSKYNVKVKFIGPVYDEDYFEECKKIADALPANVSVEFPGSMPPVEVSEELAKSHLFFLPTLGENYGHAIIESLLSGLPVLISDKTPWNDLEQDGLGRDLPLNNPDSFADYISQIAAMLQSEYETAFTSVSKNAVKRVHLNENIESYKNLFR